MTSRTPFDEAALRALFDEVEPPASIEARWRALATATLGADEERPDLTALESPPESPEPPEPPGPPVVAGPRSRPWPRAVAAGIAVLAVAGVVGAVVAHRLPPSTPDPDVTITEVPTQSSSPPPSTTTSPPSSATVPSEQQPGAGPAGGSGPRGGGPAAGKPKAPAPQPNWPNAANSGVPPGTKLLSRTGDLHLTTPGEVVSDLLVNGTIYVEAPDVTLRRVHVVPALGAQAAVKQARTAPRLQIEESDLDRAGWAGVHQEASGLTVSRSEIQSPVFVRSGVTITDSLLPSVNNISGYGDSIMLRHNTIATISLPDSYSSPITNVTIENNQLGPSGVIIYAPSRPDSHDIRVIGNHFRRDPAAGNNPAPSSGWNAQAPGNSWTGNVWFGTNDPVNP